MTTITCDVCGDIINPNEVFRISFVDGSNSVGAPNYIKTELCGRCTRNATLRSTIEYKTFRDRTRQALKNQDIQLNGE